MECSRREEGGAVTQLLFFRDSSIVGSGVPTRDWFGVRLLLRRRAASASAPVISASSYAMHCAGRDLELGVTAPTACEARRRSAGGRGPLDCCEKN